MATGCGESATGIEIAVRLGPLEYDELRFQVTPSAPGTGGAGAPQTIVDPETKGRYVGPFRPGDQSLIVYVSDELDGVAVRCAASALRAGAVVGTGAGDVTIERARITHVEIVMGSAADPVPTTGAGGAAGAPATGPGGSGGGSSAMPNGGACNIGAECVSGHCADGVCCETDCQMACRSCALPDQKGLCRPVPLGTPDPRGMCADKGPASCRTNGLCDVAGRCADYPAGTPCAPAGCSNKDEAVQARVCDGAGKCEDEIKMKCPAPSQCTAGVCS
jgi:hypothetical protein